MTDTTCDWCGRSGVARDYVVSKHGAAYVVDPILCDVCNLVLMAPGEVVDHWDDWPGAEDALAQYEEALHNRWLERRAQMSRP